MGGGEFAVRRTTVSATFTRAGALRGHRADTLLVPPVRLSLGAVIALNLGRLLMRLISTIVRRPVAVAGLGVILMAWMLLGSTRLLLAVLVVAVLVFLRHQNSFAREAYRAPEQRPNQR